MRKHHKTIDNHHFNNKVKTQFSDPNKHQMPNTKLLPVRNFHLFVYVNSPFIFINKPIKTYFWCMKNETISRWFLMTGKIEGYSYLVLVFIAMPLKYFFDTPEWVRPIGSIHGVLFVAFMLLLALMFFKVKLSFKKSLFAFLLSLLPFGTFYLKKLVLEEGGK